MTSFSPPPLQKKSVSMYYKVFYSGQKYESLRSFLSYCSTLNTIKMSGYKFKKKNQIKKTMSVG